MNPDAFAASVTRRFRAPGIRTIFGRTTSDPIAISRVVTPPILTERLPAEAGYTVHVQMGALNTGEIYSDDRPLGLRPQHTGFVRLLDMRSPTWARIDDDADFLRIHLPQRTLDELAYDRGARPVSLIRPRYNFQDPILHHLGCALLARFDTYGADDSLFIDHVSLAFHAHIVRTYAETEFPAPQRGGLAPWQVRRARDLLMENWGCKLTIKELADSCDLSVSYFTRAFRESLGVPPHQWLMNERLKRAADLLRNSGMSLKEIALSCGFSDQSHFTRAFKDKTGATPAHWRRRHGCQSA